MKHLDLFSGIGGFALAAEEVWPDIEHTFCEIDPFCQAVLKKHWPQSSIHDDIRTLHPGPADLVTGGFPCQPFSSAGKRRGTADDRHLWPEMLRVIRESSPEWVVGENVGGLLTWDGGMVLESVLSDLEAEGYEAWPFVIPACAVEAPHKRDRVWIVANRTCGRLEGRDVSVRSWGPHEASSDAYRDSIGDAGCADGISSKSGILQRDLLPKRRRQEGADSTDGSDRDGDAPNSQRTGLQERTKEDGTLLQCSFGNHRDPSSEDDTNATIERLQGSEWSSGRKGKKPDDELPHGRNRTGPSSGGRKRHAAWDEEWLSAATRLCPMDDGLPGGLVRPRGWRNAALKAAGNAIVPQVAIEIMKAIKHAST